MRKDGTGKCPVHWYVDNQGKKRWVCSSHLAPYHKHMESRENCWYSTCPGRSMVGYPYTEEEMNEKKALIAKQKIKEIEKAEIAKQKIKEIEKEHIIPVPSLSCENYGCEKPIVSTRKKYCSDKCRLQKSRADYETRNPKRRRKTETPTPQTLPAPPVPPEPSELCSSIVCNNKVMGGRRSCSDKCRKRAYRQRKKGLLRQT